MSLQMRRKEGLASRTCQNLPSREDEGLAIYQTILSRHRPAPLLLRPSPGPGSARPQFVKPLGIAKEAASRGTFRSGCSLFLADSASVALLRHPRTLKKALLLAPSLPQAAVTRSAPKRRLRPAEADTWRSICPSAPSVSRGCRARRSRRGPARESDPPDGSSTAGAR